jgi:glycine dehydrogenase subunit 1
VTHRYFPNTDEDIRRMLDAIGASTVDELFAPVPEGVRLKRELAIPPAMSEPDLLAHLESLAAQNVDPSRTPVFLGAGVYRHAAPSFIDQMLLRSEFYTAYTPYQPEISQGTLQAIFEFQTLTCQLLGTDIANASMYDGSTAMAEGALMAARMTKRARVVIARSVHPHYRAVLTTYAENLGIEVVEVDYAASGGLDWAKLEQSLVGAAAVVFQYPNFLGVIEDPHPIVSAAHAAGALSVAVVTEPVALGLLAPPGRLGVDIVAAELQSLGVPTAYGGPHCGVIGAAEKCLRQMPGRLVGMAKDSEGRIGYVLTLATREQHIRREKATSNICTNSGLMALAASMFMAALGRQGLPDLARLNFDKAHYALKAILDAGSGTGVGARFDGPFFNEFVVGGLGDAAAAQARLLEEGIVAGVPLERFYPELRDCLLLCVTEVNARSDIEALAVGLAKRTSHPGQKRG